MSPWSWSRSGPCTSTGLTGSSEAPERCDRPLRKAVRTRPPPAAAARRARGRLQFRAPHDPVRRRDRGELLGVPDRVAGAADQPAAPGIERLEPPERAGKATRRRCRAGASMTTSTSYSHPTARCSSSMATGSRSAGGSKVSSSTSTPRTRSIRYARRASAEWDRHSRYHRPWRTTTAHGSTSMAHSDPASER